MTPALFHPSRLRKFFAGRSHLPAAGPHVFQEQARRFDTAQTLIRALYAFLLYLAITQFTELGNYLNRPAYAPLWPLDWVRWTGVGADNRLLLFFYVVTNLIGPFVPESRVARVAVFLGLLEYVALKNSYGKVGHSFHLPLLVAGVLVFPAPGLAPGERNGWTAAAPDDPARFLARPGGGAHELHDERGRQAWRGGVWQAVHGQPNAFVPGALGAFIAETPARNALGQLPGRMDHPASVADVALDAADDLRRIFRVLGGVPARAGAGVGGGAHRVPRAGRFSP